MKSVFEQQKITNMADLAVRALGVATLGLWQSMNGVVLTDEQAVEYGTSLVLDDMPDQKDIHILGDKDRKSYRFLDSYADNLKPMVCIRDKEGLIIAFEERPVNFEQDELALGIVFELPPDFNTSQMYDTRTGIL